jgi:hypothetical protein
MNKATWLFGFSSIFCAFLTSVISSPLGKAASPAVSDKECNNAVVAAKARMLKIKNLQISRFETSDVMKSGYTEIPFPERSQEFNMILAGAGGANFMRSPKLMQSVSSDFIKGCKSVASVSYVMARTDWSETYGIFRDGGTIQRFKCIPQDENMPQMKLPWGTHVCL